MNTQKKDSIKKVYVNAQKMDNIRENDVYYHINTTDTTNTLIGPTKLTKLIEPHMTSVIITETGKEMNIFSVIDYFLINRTIIKTYLGYTFNHKKYDDTNKLFEALEEEGLIKVNRIKYFEIPAKSAYCWLIYEKTPIIHLNIIKDKLSNEYFIESNETIVDTKLGKQIISFLLKKLKFESLKIDMIYVTQNLKPIIEEMNIGDVVIEYV
jgi:hypothetical protein